MKKFLMAAAALVAFAGSAGAADLGARPVYTKAPAAAVMAYNWTGFYLGVDAGYGWGRYTQFAAPGDGVSVDPKGFVIGGHVGYNQQINNFVVGLEADLSTGPRGSTALGTVGPAFLCGSGDCVVNIDWFGTVRARLGLAANNWLFYGTGGLAYGRASGGIENSSYTGNSTKAGWVAGAGIEYAFNPNWTARVEYLHVDLGTVDFGVTGAGAQFSARGNFDVVRGGISYKFGGPVVAKY